MQMIESTIIHLLKNMIVRKEFLEALEYIEGMSPEERETWEVQKLLGSICFAFGEFEGAEKCYLAALRQNPNSSEIMHSLKDVRAKSEEERKIRFKQEPAREIPSSVYDNLYEGGGLRGTYHAKYKDSIYYQCWLTAMSYLYLADRSMSILEIACGVGQFANLLFDNGFHNYVGFDFSDKGIILAKQNNPQYSSRFHVADAFQTELVEKSYDLVICFEMLEHVRRDIELLQRIKKGTKLLLSVPNFDDPNHVRFFERIGDVVERYQNVVNIYDIRVSNITQVTRLYYILGERK